MNSINRRLARLRAKLVLPKSTRNHAPLCTVSLLESLAAPRLATAAKFRLVDRIELRRGKPLGLNVTAAICGDPSPGRSALEERR